MESTPKGMQRQKITLAFYLLKEKDEKELFNKWNIYTGRKYIIGRGKECDIDIDSLLLSRPHLELVYYTNNLITIKDLDSRNGTFINDAKIKPNQEIKFTTKDKLSLGDTNNKVEFLENNEIKEVFEERKTNEIFTEKVSNNQNIFKSYKEQRPNFNNNRNNRYNTYTKNNNIRPRFRKNFTTFKRDQKVNDINIDTMINLLKNEGRTPFPYRRRFRNRFVGRKLQRNENNNVYENKTKKKLEGLEKLKEKLDDNDKNVEEEENDEEFDEEDDDDIIDIEEEKGNKNEKIILKTNKLNKLEFVLPVKGKSLKQLKGVKKVKCLVSGYVVLNVKKKKFIYE